MRDDDINWLDASSDFGLISLCNELAALARPLDAIARRASVPHQTPTRRRTRRTRPVSKTAPATLASA